MTLSIDEALRRFAPQLPLAVALSGGADSVALLNASRQKWPGQVVALHVNHGLQRQAVQFEQFCSTLCKQWEVPLRIAVVDARHRSGTAPEATARRARYRALVDLALGKYGHSAITSVAVAHHAHDQLETMLLAMSRGAGLAGLSAMAPTWSLSGVDFHRPLLSVSRDAIRTWLTAQGCEYVTDPSNTDTRFTRNHIRARILPAICETFPQALDTFARSAAHAAQAQSLLNELAQSDLSQLKDALDSGPKIRALQGLSRPRQANALRFWLKRDWQVIPSTSQLDELLHQIQCCVTGGHRIHVKTGDGFVERKGAHLTWYNPQVLLQIINIPWH